MIGEGTQSTNQRRHDYVATGRVVGFYTDPTICIGCKACEVACKEWNQVPDDGYRWSGNSYDNTDALGASTWRHVLFIEQDRARGGGQIAGPMMGHNGQAPSATALAGSGSSLETINRAGCDTPSYGHSVGTGHSHGASANGHGEVTARTDGQASAHGTTGAEDPFRWLFISDVCKHCEEAGCLESCPTGSIVRTEVGSVLVQNDVCNGCGYCVVACPFGVIDKRKPPLLDAGGAFKCTFCYDRQASGLTPACAKACPTESILFGPLDELRVHAQTQGRSLAQARVPRRAQLRSAGNQRARHPRFFPAAWRAGSLRPAAQAADPDHPPQGRVDLGFPHRRRCPRRDAAGLRISLRADSFNK